MPVLLVCEVEVGGRGETHLISGLPVKESITLLIAVDALST